MAKLRITQALYGPFPEYIKTAWINVDIQYTIPCVETYNRQIAFSSGMLALKYAGKIKAVEYYEEKIKGGLLGFPKHACIVLV